MTERKELGQLAYEAYNSGRQWGGLWTIEREAWARVEAAIYEEAVKVLSEMRKQTRTLGPEGMGALMDAEAAIRAKIGGSHG